MKRICAALVTIAILGGTLQAAVAEDDTYAPIRAKLKTCTTCHGDKGASTLPQYPILAGQQMYYMYVQLKDFKANRRKDPIMSVIAGTLDKDEMKLLTTYFSEQQWPKTDGKVTVSKEQQHKAERMAGSAECTACHLGGYKGNSRVPRLGGQHHDYLLKTMLDLKYKRRTNVPFMTSLLATFDDDDIKAMAQYLASLHD